MASDTVIAWQMCDDEEDSATVDLATATNAFEQWKKHMRQVNMKTPTDDEGEPREPQRGEHRVKVTLSDKSGKKLNEFRHKCICESPY